MEKEPPYKQSRAALRDQFGARSIDASAPQADTSKNIGATGAQSLVDNLDDALRWGNTFKNSTTGQTTSPWAKGLLSNPDNYASLPLAGMQNADRMGVWTEDKSAPLNGFWNKFTSHMSNAMSSQPEKNPIVPEPTDSLSQWTGVGDYLKQGREATPQKSGNFGTISSVQFPDLQLRRLTSRFGTGSSRT